jgi:ectoine hydroxylase-related dioxygenase (phytanoyl-CoA dioxygenase family)
VQIVPGSHKLGLVNPAHGSGFLTKEQAADLCSPDKAEYMEVPAGECVLMHNWLLHGSDINRTDIPRRAFSVCYMDARTKASNGETFTTIFGEGALSPDRLGEVATAGAR